MAGIRTTRWTAGAFFAGAALLYLYGVLLTPHMPVQAAAVALPLDFMVGIPLAFYLLVVRPRCLTPLLVLPAIWLGYGLSVLALGAVDAGVLPLLLAALVPVEVGIAGCEVVRIVRAFRKAKAASEDPMEWLFAATRQLVRKELPARMMAAELAVWYYALFSWRERSQAPAEEARYSYHNAGGYLNMMMGLALAFPVEIVGVHLLLSQWSAAAAWVATLLSVYAGVWLVGDARARIMRPVTVGSEGLRLECGIQMQARIPFDTVARVAAAEPAADAIGKAERLNYGTFYQANVWVVAERPVEVRTLLGTKRVRAIGLSLDDPQAFIADVGARLGVQDG